MSTTTITKTMGMPIITAYTEYTRVNGFIRLGDFVIFCILLLPDDVDDALGFW